MKAVILAAGRGSRMQQSATSASLTEAQRRAADGGLKGLMPINGRPFLDYVMSALADAAVEEICLVVGPGPHPIRVHFEQVATERVSISYAVQDAPHGGAHALLAAESFADGDPVLVINSDNYYPAPVIAALSADAGSALAGFSRAALVTDGNIPRERLAAYAIVTVDTDGMLTGITEKPGLAELNRTEGHEGSWISMTCWRFRAPIFAACRAVEPSPRGEYELPDAVRYAISELGERFHVVPAHAPVLDLTTRDDIAAVERALRDVAVRL
jgi:glucose-1-phosphate thymidylyltransferase